MTIAPNKYRTLFISDLHLGSHHCQAERLLRFLKAVSADTIYLIGDVIGHHTYLKNWPPYHNAVLSEIAKKSLTGTNIIYIPGNHDAIFRHHVGSYGNLAIVKECTFLRGDGRIFLVTHGDETDMLGLGLILAVLVRIEKFMPISFWEVLRKLLKGTIAAHTTKFQAKMLKRAKGYDGVICGHIHYPCLTNSYCNSGDWVHHCTAIAETHDGSFQLLKG